MRIPARLLLLTILSLQLSSVQATTFIQHRLRQAAAPQEINAVSSNEASALLTLHYIHAAEATFQATVGQGRFGTLLQLYKAKLIDAKLRTGFIHGYRFELTVSNPPNAPSTFIATARPLTYLETGVRSFSLNEGGALRVSYRQNPTLAEMQLLVDECGSVFCTEAFALAALRNIHSAEATFQATAGNGRYGTMQELVEQNLISPFLARESLNGYTFQIRVQNGAAGEPASFEAFATPLRYPRTGVRSFYIDETGVLRGANKNGREADAGDDPTCQ